MSTENKVKAFVLGYTGETGKALIKQLACDGFFSSIVLIGRRQVELRDLEITDDSKFVSDSFHATDAVQKLVITYNIYRQRESATEFGFRYRNVARSLGIF